MIQFWQRLILMCIWFVFLFIFIYVFRTLHAYEWPFLFPCTWYERIRTIHSCKYSIWWWIWTIFTYTKSIPSYWQSIQVRKFKLNELNWMFLWHFENIHGKIAFPLEAKKEKKWWNEWMNERLKENKKKGFIAIILSLSLSNEMIQSLFSSLLILEKSSVQYIVQKSNAFLSIVELCIFFVSFILCHFLLLHFHGSISIYYSFSFL